MKMAAPRDKWIFLTVVAVLLLALPGCRGMLARQFLFYPSHEAPNGRLAEWKDAQGNGIGFCREVASPENVWLMIHGNAGQAQDRAYAMGSFSGRDSVYVLEYPGYGQRAGKASKEAFNKAAIEAYQLLRQRFPGKPVCVVGESIGSGASCVLAGQTPPPDKIVLVVPFDNLGSVASDHVPLGGWILGTTWDNTKALSTYQGRIEIFGARADSVIPIRHAEALARSLPAARFHLLDCGHNEWSERGQVEIRNP